MKVNAEKLEGNKAKLTIEVPAERFEKSMDKAYRSAVKKLNVPGFRKGKAPRHVIERMYGRELFLDDAVKDAIPEAFSDALDELDGQYECIVYPEYDIVSAEKGAGLIFTAVYDLKPEVSLGHYKGMTLEKVDAQPEEGAVEKQLKAMQERFARLDDVTGPAETGDVCTIDFLGKVDDVPFAGGEAADHPLELGGGRFIPGFEEQLIGAMVGDHVAVQVTFPEEYHAAELAGQAAVFEVDIKEIKRKMYSPMDDDFAKDVSEFDTLEELKADLAEKLAKESKEKAQADMETKAVEKVIEEADLTLPDTMIALRQDQLLESFARQVRRQGMELEQYMQMTGLQVADVRNSMAERAAQELKTELVLEAVAQAEGLEVSDEDLAAEYSRLAEQTGRPVEEIQDIYGGNKTMVESLKLNLRINKAIKTLTDQAIWVEKAPAPETALAAADPTPVEPVAATEAAVDKEEA